MISNKEMQEKHSIDGEELRRVISRVFSNRRNKYVLFEQQSDVIKLINFAHNIQFVKTQIPYNILIISDNTEKSEELCENISLVAESVGVLEKKIVGCDIKEWYTLKKTFEDIEKLYSCLVIKNVEISDLKGENWECMVEMMRNDHTPSLIKIMCVTKAAAEFLKTQYEDIYYRFFANDYHITMDKNEVEATAVYQEFLQRLKNERYQIQEEFDTGIKEYIETVYPKAVEREMSFVNDLYNRVIRAVLIRETASRQIDKSCIPFYQKKAIVKENATDTADIKKECPPARKIAVNDKSEENVLFFNLSVLRKGIMSKYRGKYQDKEIDYTGISQLEAGTKHILHSLALEGKKLDRIVIVESKATRTDDHTEYVETFWDNPGETKKYYISSIYFYKQRIKDYLRRKDDKEIFKNVEDTYYEENRSFETRFPDTVEYTENEIKDLFYDIPTYETDDDLEKEEFECYKEQSLELFAEIIHGIQGESGKRINLYVDMQGGFRSTVSQTDTVLELLKDRNVTIKGRYAIKGFVPNGKKVHDVDLVDAEYKSYELVSAMTEFKRYGRGQGLAEFFAKDTNPETKRIIESIKNISGAIALCNVDEFEKQIKNLAEINNELKNKQLNSQISIVFQDIIEDYAPLLKAESTTFDIVKWCAEKCFYQQAITIIESRMPKMLVECGFLHYNPLELVDVIPETQKRRDVSENQNSRTKMEQKAICYVCDCVKREKGQWWKDNINLLFESWITCNREKGGEYFGVELEELKKMYNNGFKLKEKPKIRRIKLQMKKKYAEYAEYSEGLKQDSDAVGFCLFTALSAELKEIRNSINHANAEKNEGVRETSREEYIKSMLELYLDIGDRLKLNIKRIDKKKETRKIEIGKQTNFVVTQIGATKKNKANLVGYVEGEYKGTIQSNSLPEMNSVQLEEMCGEILQVKVNGVNNGRYLLSYIMEEK